MSAPGAGTGAIEKLTAGLVAASPAVMFAAVTVTDTSRPTRSCESAVQSDEGRAMFVAVV
jgi:hypothetical protein